MAADIIGTVVRQQYRQEHTAAVVVVVVLILTNGQIRLRGVTKVLEPQEDPKNREN